MIMGVRLSVHFLWIASVFFLRFQESHARSNKNLMIDIDYLEKQGNPEMYLATIRQMAQALNKCGLDIREVSQMKKKMLSTNGAKCMDGSPAAYYLRKSSESTDWLIYLQGGSYCFSKESCNKRKSNSPNLTSSTNWPDRMEGSGILSWDADQNPLFYGANIVYIPYCSGDAWTGNRKKAKSYYRGSVIVEDVVKDLIGLHGGPKSGSRIYLSGSSAGGIGVLMNIDRVSDLITSRVPGTTVLGIVDSGWFLDLKSHYKPKQCNTPLDCRPSESVKKGYRLWQPKVPRACAEAYSSTPWHCFFGYKLYKYLKTPVFVIQYLYDTAQLYSLLQSTHLSEEGRRNEARNIGQQINNSLETVSAAFAVGCFSHEVLEESYWHRLSLNGVTLFDALRCWMTSQEATNRPTSLLRQNAKQLVNEYFRSNSNPNRENNRIPPRQEIDTNRMTNRIKQIEKKVLAQCSFKVLDTCTTPNCNNQCPPIMSSSRSARSIGSLRKRRSNHKMAAITFDENSLSS